MDKRGSLALPLFLCRVTTPTLTRRRQHGKGTRDTQVARHDHLLASPRLKRKNHAPDPSRKRKPGTSPRPSVFRLPSSVFRPLTYPSRREPPSLERPEADEREDLDDRDSLRREGALDWRLGADGVERRCGAERVEVERLGVERLGAEARPLDWGTDRGERLGVERWAG